MKKALLFSILILGLSFFYSCGDDDPLPISDAGFTFDPPIAEVGVPVMFDNLSTNAQSYAWFINGDSASTEISPSFVFNSPGIAEVVLRAITADGQVDTTFERLEVRERILTGYFVNIFPEMNGEMTWDPDTLDNDTIYADMLVQLIPTDVNNPGGIIDGIFTDVAEAPFGNNIDPTISEVILTDEDWAFSLFDFDGDDPNDIDNDDVEFIIGVQFNPVQAPTFKNQAGDAGFFSIFLFDQELGIIDVDISFDLE